MATLRIAFIESLKPLRFPFVTAVPYFQLPSQQFSNNDDILK